MNDAQGRRVWIALCVIWTVVILLIAYTRQTGPSVFDLFFIVLPWGAYVLCPD